MRLGTKMSEEAKRKISEAAKRRHQDPTFRASVLARGPLRLTPSQRIARGERMSVTATNYWRARREAIRHPDLPPLGTRMKLSAEGLTKDGPAHHGYTADTRATVVLGLWPDSSFLCLLVDGEKEPSHWFAKIWEPAG